MKEVTMPCTKGFSKLTDLKEIKAIESVKPITFQVPADYALIFLYIQKSFRATEHISVFIAAKLFKSCSLLKFLYNTSNIH